MYNVVTKLHKIHYVEKFLDALFLVNSYKAIIIGRKNLFDYYLF